MCKCLKVTKVTKVTLMCFSIALFVMSCSSYPQLPAGTAESRDQRIKQYLDQLTTEDRMPGIQYMAVDANGVLFEYASGEAVITKTAMSLTSPMMFYSVTKVLTATAVLQLVEQKKIELDELLEQYLPFIPYRGVTIRQVLTHRSGIPNPILGNFYVHSASEAGSFDRQSLLKQILLDNQQLEFTPGSDYSYSNLAFALLGELIEKVSHKSYEQYIQQNILKPLKINSDQASFSYNTFESDSRGYVERFSVYNLIISFMLQGFTSQTEQGWKTFTQHWYLNYPAHGGLIVNAPAVSLFLKDQLSEQSKLLSPAQKAELYRIQKPAKSSAMRSTDIALAWFINRDAKETYYFHEGSGFGYVAEVRIYPKSAIASVLLANTTKMPHKNLMDMIDNQFKNKQDRSYKE
ncbi:MAG: beta-lactamase family protein [Gammaproteobacteria bacterium]|nr:beta-lactamase family protein [Gammaproteobacteria bacterium]